MTRMLLLAVAVTACAGREPMPPPPPEPPPPRVGDAPRQPRPPAPEPVSPPAEETSSLVARNFAIAAGQDAFVELEVEAGAAVSARYRSDQSIGWRVHALDGGTTVHDQGDGDQGVVAFQAGAAGRYRVVWRNRGRQAANVIVSVEVPAGARITAWNPEN